MGFKQRERRRQRRQAMAEAQRDARASGSSAGRWWLTVVARTTCCAVCGMVLREGGEMVYRHTPREARCTSCAGGLGYRPSVRWERARRARA